jgi:SOS-response transcriptional repressor LexA
MLYLFVEAEMAGQKDGEILVNNKIEYEEELLTAQERRFLVLAEAYINDPVNQNGLFPTNKWFENILSITKAGVSNLKSNLFKKAILEKRNGRIQLTQKAWDFLKSNSQGEVPNIFILKPGQVSAGLAAGGELEVLASEIMDLIEDMLPIPAIEPRGKVVAYQVKGDSMESEGIYEGDYVLVEVNPGVALTKNKMIVAKYFLRGDVRSELRGPTLKIYKGEDKDSKGKYALLGRTKDYGQKIHLILRRGKFTLLVQLLGFIELYNRK